MNRVKKTIFCAVICLVCALWLWYPRYWYHSPMALFEAHERGFHIGPSTVILDEFATAETEKVIIGLWEDGLSVLEMERKNPWMWGLAGGVTGYNPPRFTIDWDAIDSVVLCGMVRDDAIDSVVFEMSAMADGTDTIYETTVQLEASDIDEYGYFRVDIPWGDAIEELGQSNLWYPRVDYLEAKDADGNIVLQKGDAPDGTYYPGEYIYDHDRDYAQEAVDTYLAQSDNS